VLGAFSFEPPEEEKSPIAVTTLCLVGCSKRKLCHPAPANDLYRSTLFRLSRQWAELHADAWAILSARYGVVDPDAVIEPYDTTVADRTPFGMARLTPKEFGFWLYASVQAWRSRFATANQAPALVVLAGRDYWRWLVEHRLPLNTPLDGLGIGQRLHWLKEQIAAHAGDTTIQARSAVLQSVTPQKTLFDMQITEDPS
jgi:hypothetical protein